ncbi:hypothetical protein Hanom_Chr14g01267811 [Helianthus anomalus]
MLFDIKNKYINYIYFNKRIVVIFEIRNKYIIANNVPNRCFGRLQSVVESNILLCLFS